MTQIKVNYVQVERVKTVTAYLCVCFCLMKAALNKRATVDSTIPRVSSKQTLLPRPLLPVRRPTACQPRTCGVHVVLKNYIILARRLCSLLITCVFLCRRVLWPGLNPDSTQRERTHWLEHRFWRQSAN